MDRKKVKVGCFKKIVRSEAMTVHSYFIFIPFSSLFHSLKPEFAWPYNLTFGVHSLDDFVLGRVFIHGMRNFGNNSFILKTRPGSTLRILTSFDIESDSNYLITVTFANLTLIQNDKFVKSFNKMSLLSEKCHRLSIILIFRKIENFG